MTNALEKKGRIRRTISSEIAEDYERFAESEGDVKRVFHRFVEIVNKVLDNFCLIMSKSRKYVV